VGVWDVGRGERGREGGREGGRESVITACRRDESSGLEL